MNGQIPVLIIILVFSPIINASPEINIKGILVWSPDKQTITKCSSNHVYQVRVLASNPFYHLTKKVEKLGLEGAGKIIAEFRGELATDTDSVKLQYPVDGMLYVHEIISVKEGECITRFLVEKSYTKVE